MAVQYNDYVEEMCRLISTYQPQMLRSDIRDAIQYSINKRYKEVPCKIHNNYTKEMLDGTLLDMANWINEREPICTAYGVLFKKHSKKMNPLCEMIKSFMEGRDIDKAKMFEALAKHDYENAAKYNLFQLLDKRDCNSIYGCLGNASSLLYNLYVAASITMQGRSTISTATMFFESFMANNVKFASLEEVLHFIDCVCLERPNRRYNDNQILNRNISLEEVFIKIMKTCGDWRKGKLKWVPDYNDARIIYTVLRNLDQENLNRLFYKNNLYAFLDNVTIINGIKYILKTLKEPYLSPNNVPEEIKVELDALQDLFREYVFYDHMYMDRIDRCNNMIKDVCVISDTDSTIVTFDAFYHYVLDKIEGEKIPIAGMEIDDIGEYLEGNKEALRLVPVKEVRYDFFTDEVIEKESMTRPFVMIPQNNLRFSIINIIAYIAGNLCNEYIVTYTKTNHSWGENKKCLLYLKNEFLFSRALLTMNKKNYATNQELKEGVILEQTRERALDVKGMSINKSTLNPSIKDELQKILYEDILVADHIDQVRIIEKIAILEKNIEASLRKGEKKYYKPAVIKAIDNYDEPLRIQGIKASMVWNKVKDGLEGIDLNTRNTIDIVKVIITPANIESIKDEYPNVFEGFLDIFSEGRIFNIKSSDTESQKMRKLVIDAIAVPGDVKPPEWIAKFIDYKTIINDNISNFPFESVGIPRMGAEASISYSTLMKI